MASQRQQIKASFDIVQVSLAQGPLPVPECYMTPAQNHRVGTESPLLHIQECEAAGCSVLGRQECLMLQCIAREAQASEVEGKICDVVDVV